MNEEFQIEDFRLQIGLWLSAFDLHLGIPLRKLGRLWAWVFGLEDRSWWKNKNQQRPKTKNRMPKG
jgi:hypothetical protein